MTSICQGGSHLPVWKKAACLLVAAQCMIIIYLYTNGGVFNHIYAAKGYPGPNLDIRNFINVSINSIINNGIGDTHVSEQSTVIHVHREHAMYGHAFIHGDTSVFRNVSQTFGYHVDSQAYIQTTSRISVAIGLGLTTRKFKDITANLTKLAFFKTFVPSFCKTVSKNYDYRFYIAYDITDPHLGNNTFLTLFVETFTNIIRKKCRTDSSYSLHVVQCSHSGSPAWAQNDAMLEAYMENADYYYRVNDDTIMTSRNWTNRFISTLAGYKPPLVGVVGPHHRGGNTGILTYDFVHKTHVDIFGFYYPRRFPAWYADRWITLVYQPDRSTKLSDIKLTHTMSKGTRYSIRKLSGKTMNALVQNGQDLVTRYIRYKESPLPEEVNGRRVVAISLFGAEPNATWGAVRNAQLLPVLLPGWTLRVYVPLQTSEEYQSQSNSLQRENVAELSSGAESSSLNTTENQSDQMSVPPTVIAKLQSLGATIVRVPRSASSLPPETWSYLVVDDPEVEYFLVRSPLSRLSDRDAKAIQVWLKSEKAFHCMRDNAKHADNPINHGLFGARTATLRTRIDKSVLSLLDDYFKNTTVDSDGTLAATKFLSDVLWPFVQNSIICHDSISCDKWPETVPFLSQSNNTFIGQRYDRNEQPLNVDIALKGYVHNPKCLLT